MVKLVWAMAAIVLLVGFVKAVMVFHESQQTDRKVLIRKSK
jgi:hypothetical protein